MPCVVWPWLSLPSVVVGGLLVLAVAAVPVMGEAIVLENTDPTRFNVFSDLVSEATTLIFGLAAGYLYGVLLSLDIFHGRSVAISQFQVPGNFVSSWMRVKNALSLPAIFFAFLLTLQQSSHLIADSGLTFASNVEKGFKSVSR